MLEHDRPLGLLEGIEEHARIVAPVADALEQRDATIAARDRLAIEDARAGAQGRSTHRAGQVLARAP